MVVSWFVPIIPAYGVISCSLPGGENKEFWVTLKTLLYPAKCTFDSTNLSPGMQI